MPPAGRGDCTDPPTHHKDSIDAAAGQDPEFFSLAWIKGHLSTDDRYAPS